MLPVTSALPPLDDLVKPRTGMEALLTSAVQGMAESLGRQVAPVMAELSVALFFTAAGRLALVCAVTTHCTAAPGGNVPMVTFTAPVPLAGVNTAAAEPVEVQLHAKLSIPVGTASASTAPSATTTPALRASRV